MLVISPTTWICVKPATTATTAQVIIVVMCGVPKRGWTLLTPFGSRPSRLMAKKMRGWLISITSSTLVMPATAPAETRYEAQSWPISASAKATGALRNCEMAVGSAVGMPGSASTLDRYCVTGTIPERTAETAR
jgi:hypothetical protein